MCGERREKPGHMYDRSGFRYTYRPENGLYRIGVFERNLGVFHRNILGTFRGLPYTNCKCTFSSLPTGSFATRR